MPRIKRTDEEATLMLEILVSRSTQVRIGEQFGVHPNTVKAWLTGGVPVTRSEQIRAAFQKMDEIAPRCHYNPGVDCFDAPRHPEACITCGWNPEEAARRREEFRKERERRRLTSKYSRS